MSTSDSVQSFCSTQTPPMTDNKMGLSETSSESPLSNPHLSDSLRHQFPSLALIKPTSDFRRIPSAAWFNLILTSKFVVLL